MDEGVHAVFVINELEDECVNRIRVRVEWEILLVVLFFAQAVLGALRLPSVFSNHMVLLRDAPVPVWGTAVAGETVTVEFAGQKKTAVTDSSNHWK